MIKNVFFFVLMVQTLYAQNDVVIKGVIKAENASVEGIHVVNLSSEKTTVTNAQGEFSIEAKEDDLLVFSAIHLDYARKSISKSDYQVKSISVEMFPKITELDEVVVTEYTKINAKDLGIINYTPKVYTPAERKLYTALSSGSGIPLDPLINWITGRTKMLKKEIQVEKRELLRERLEAYYEDVFFMESLKIPELYVEGFKYYVVEDEDLAVALNQKNKTKATFVLSKLAADFNNFLKDEK